MKQTNPETGNDAALRISLAAQDYGRAEQARRDAEKHMKLESLDDLEVFNVCETDGAYINMMVEYSQHYSTEGKRIPQLIVETEDVITSAAAPYVKQYVGHLESQGKQIPYHVGRALVSNEANIMTTLYGSKAASDAMVEKIEDLTDKVATPPPIPASALSKREYKQAYRKAA